MKAANFNPMGSKSGSTGIDHGAVRLARKKAAISNYDTSGTNTAATGVSLSRPKADSNPATSKMGKGAPAPTARAGKLKRKTRTS